VRSKLDRLRSLAQSSPVAFPPTAWSVSQFDELQGTGPWYLRVDDGYDGSTGPLSTEQARQIMTERESSVAVQPLIEAQLAGAMFVGGRHLLIEAVRGDAAPLLRGGAAGVAILVEPGGRYWVNGDLPLRRGSLAHFARDLMNLAAPHGSGEAAAILEWIVDMDDRTWLVDLKPVPRSFVRWHVSAARNAFYVGFAPDEKLPAEPSAEGSSTLASVRLGDTALDRTELAESAEGIIWCESGAVLSHLLTRLGARGRRSCVRVNAGEWESAVS
jgi:hypothetical protein